jgi:hypothetical protein
MYFRWASGAARCARNHYCPRCDYFAATIRARAGLGPSRLCIHTIYHYFQHQLPSVALQASPLSWRPNSMMASFVPSTSPKSPWETSPPRVLTLCSSRRRVRMRSAQNPPITRRCPSASRRHVPPLPSHNCQACLAPTHPPTHLTTDLLPHPHPCVLLQARSSPLAR